jgi:hypothetical protein
LSHSSVARVIAPLVSLGVVQEKMLGKRVRLFPAQYGKEVTSAIADFYRKINHTVN